MFLRFYDKLFRLQYCKEILQKRLFHIFQEYKTNKKYSNGKTLKLRKCWDLHLHPFAGILNTLAIKRKFKRKVFNATSAELPFPWCSAN